MRGRRFSVLFLLGLMASASCGSDEPRSVEAARKLELDKSEHTQRREALERLQALGYANWDEIDEDAETGVTLHERSRAQPGYNLYANEVDEVYLLDNEGVALHSWKFPDERRCLFARLLEDGSLVAIFTDSSVGCFDWSSERIWSCEIAAHHDIGLDSDGSMWIPYREEPRDWNDNPVIFDGLARVSPAGEPLLSWSTFEQHEKLLALHGATPLDELRWRPGKESYDYYHLNTVQVLPPNARDDDERFRAGNLLICLRNVSLALILDAHDLEVVWSFGDLDHPHMPTMLPSGNILVFDNGRVRGTTRVIELDPVSGEVVWEFARPDDPAFFSKYKGSCQRLANGNTLICYADRGHAVEVTPEGELVWEFWNPIIENGKRRQIYRMERYPAALVDRLLAADEH